MGDDVVHDTVCDDNNKTRFGNSTTAGHYDDDDNNGSNGTARKLKGRWVIECAGQNIKGGMGIRMRQREY